jgi:broad specificity phosphatase PhoE
MADVRDHVVVANEPRQLFLEMHATSVDNVAGRASGWDDVDLADIGVRQAHELGTRYADRDLAAVFCSELRRARRTAEIAFPGGSVRVVVDARLRECDYGRLTGSTVSTIDRLRVESVDTPFPGGESYQQVTGRVKSCLDDIAADPDRRPVLVIGHRATFYALEHLLKGAAMRDAVAAPWHWQPGWTYQLPAPAQAAARVHR